MSSFSAFMKKNKKDSSKTVSYAATKSLVDEKGAPLKWKIKTLTTKQMNKLQDKHSCDVPIPGKAGAYRTKINNSAFMAGMICESVVYPDLKNAELQDSYGVKTAEDLLLEMVDNAAEYSDLLEKVGSLNGYTDIGKDIDAAKNS